MSNSSNAIAQAVAAMRIAADGLDELATAESSSLMRAQYVAQATRLRAAADAGEGEG